MSDILTCRGVARDAGDQRGVVVAFNRRLTDDEFRQFHDANREIAKRLNLTASGPESTLERFAREVREGTAQFVTPDGGPAGDTEMYAPSRSRQVVNDVVEKMHAPRLQLRWAVATEEEAESHTPASLRAVFKSPIWTCHYELVLPLRKGDIRQGESDESNPDLFVVSLGSTTVSSSRQCEPTSPPYRDGHHAQWDAAQLGNLPVYHVASDGSFRLQEEPQ